METFKPPYRRTSIFLAGSIEQGKAEDWQSRVEEALKDFDVTIYNPRRDDWNADWVQSIHNPDFKGQVDWELDHLDKADIIIMYFDGKTLSPITILEYGLYARSGKIILFCPQEFWRKGNIDIVADRLNVTQVGSYDELITAVKGKL